MTEKKRRTSTSTRCVRLLRVRTDRFSVRFLRVRVLCRSTFTLGVATITIAAGANGRYAVAIDERKTSISSFDETIDETAVYHRLFDDHIRGF